MQKHSHVIFVLQNPEHCEEAQDMLSEICPISSHDNPGNSIEAEELSAAEKEVGPVPVLFPEIRTESKVSSVSVSILWVFKSIRIACFAKLNLRISL
jgi:hypothetical protein